MAIEDAIFLARMCAARFTLIHRRDELRGAKSLQNRLMSLDNGRIWDTVVEEIVRFG